MCNTIHVITMTRGPNGTVSTRTKELDDIQDGKVDECNAADKTLSLWLMKQKRK